MENTHLGSCALPSEEVSSREGQKCGERLQINVLEVPSAYSNSQIEPITLWL